MFKILKEKRPKILVIGDLIIDKYLNGKINRVSPEAPVQIIDVINETYSLGGAGNVIKNLKSLNADVGVISVLGNDINSSLIIRLSNFFILSSVAMGLLGDRISFSNNFPL